VDELKVTQKTRQGGLYRLNEDGSLTRLEPVDPNQSKVKPVKKLEVKKDVN